jgi:predicted porin
MKKSLIALAALGAFAGSAMAQSSVTLYGIVDMGLVKQNRADTAATGLALGGVGMTNKELNVAQATKSRLGFRGVEDLGGGYKAKFKLEHRLSVDTGSTTNATEFWDMSVVSLETPVGEIGAGRDYMPAFYLQVKQDPWVNQGIAEVGGTTYAFATYNGVRSARMNNAVFYTIAAQGVTVQAAASLKEAGTAPVATTPTAEAGQKNRFGINVMYDAGPLFLGLAYDQAEPVTGQDSNMVMVGGAYDFGVIKPRLTYTQADLANGTKPKSIILAATVPVDTNLVKLGFANMDLDNTAGTKANKISIGYEHVLSKRTAVYTDVTNGKVKGLQTVTGFDVGVRHSF